MTISTEKEEGKGESLTLIKSPKLVYVKKICVIKYRLCQQLSLLCAEFSKIELFASVSSDNVIIDCHVFFMSWDKQKRMKQYSHSDLQC